MSLTVSTERSDEVGVLGCKESVEEQVDEAILEKFVEWGLKGQPNRDSFIARRLTASATHCEGRRVKGSEACYHCTYCAVFAATVVRLTRPCLTHIGNIPAAN